jgi:hypothetical protein
LLAYAFRENVLEDVRFFVGSGAKEITGNPLALIYGYPLSQHERKVVLTKHIEKVKALQERISKTIFAKHFADFSHYILAQEQTLAQDDIESIFGPDWLSFITVKDKTVIADPGTSRESLFKFARLIDELSTEEESVIYIIQSNEETDVVTISCVESLQHLLEPNRDYFVEETPRYKEFLDRIAKEEIFDNKTVSVRFILPDSNFESGNSSEMSLSPIP